jgi:Tfp pilus assembly protein PilX
MRGFPGRQHGITLFIALVLLVLMTLFAVTTFNLGKSSLMVVGNMQARTQAAVVANSTLEEVISKTDFFKTPAAALASPCSSVANTRCYDINGDGVNDITVTLSPQPVCKTSRVIQVSELNLSNANDAGCSTGVTQSFGIIGAASGDSLCADTVWELTAVATDSITKASTTVAQGVSVRVSTSDVLTNCP